MGVEELVYQECQQGTTLGEMDGIQTLQGLTYDRRTCHILPSRVDGLNEQTTGRRVTMDSTGNIKHSLNKIDFMAYDKTLIG